MKKNFNYILIFCFGAMLFSCEQAINIQLPEYEPQLVLHSLLEEDSTIKVYVTESRPYFEYVDQQDQFRFIKNARVALLNNTDSEILQLDSMVQRGTWFNPFFGGISDSFYTYFFESTSIGIFGTEYTVEVEFNDKTASGKTTIPAAVPIDSSVVGIEIFDYGFGDVDTQQVLKFYFTDPVGEGDAYFVEYSIEGWIYDFDFQTLQVTDSFFSTSIYNNDNFQTDLNRDGKSITITSSFGLREYGHPTEERTVNVNASMVRTNSDVGEFYRTLNQQQNSNGDPFTEPSNIVSNVTGGLGVIGGKVTSPPFTSQIKVEPIFR